MYQMSKASQIEVARRQKIWEAKRAANISTHKKYIDTLTTSELASCVETGLRKFHAEI